MNVVIYARYSSHNQRDASIEQQVNACQKYAEAHKYSVIKVYADRALSGKTDQRPEFLRMINDAVKGTFDYVLVYTLDRFSRNRYDSAVYKARLKKHNIKVLSAKENITDDPAGILMESVLEGMAEYYSAELAQKVKRGMLDGAEKRQTLGKLILGYKKGADGQFVIDSATQPLVIEIFERYASGQTKAMIIDVMAAKGLLLTNNKLKLMLANPKYIGVYKWGEIEIKDGMPAIIDELLFYKVQSMTNNTTRKKQDSKANFLLTGKVYCGLCQSPISGVSGTSKTEKTYYYYSCLGAYKKKTCTAKAVKKDDLEQTIVNATLKHVVKNETTINYIVDSVMKLQAKEAEKPELKAVNAELKQIDKDLDKLINVILNDVLSDTIKEKLSVLEDRKRVLLSQQAELSIDLPQLSREAVTYWLSRFKNGDADDSKFRDELINVFVRSVHVYPEKLIITYNYTDPQYAENIDKNESSFLARLVVPTGFEPVLPA